MSPVEGPARPDPKPGGPKKPKPKRWVEMFGRDIPVPGPRSQKILAGLWLCLTGHASTMIETPECE